MKLKKSELRAVKCLLISLLWDDMSPSNEEEAIIKADGIRKINCIVEKADEIEGKVYCVAMKGNVIDTQGDWYSNETVKQTAETFFTYLAEEVKKNAPSDTNHNLQVADGIKLVQSYVDESNPESFVWRVVLDINGHEIAMQKAKEKKITGVSIYGTAERIEKADENILKTIAETVKNSAMEAWRGFFTKSTKETYDDRKKMIEGYAELDQIDNAFYAFRANIFTFEKGGEFPMVVEQESYLKEIEELAGVLKEMKFKNFQIKKGEDTMKTVKEFQDFIATKEGKEALLTEEAKKALAEAGYIPKPAEPTVTAPAGNTAPATDKTIEEANAEIAKASGKITELEKANKDLTDKVSELEKKTATSDLKPDLTPKPLTPDEEVAKIKKDALDKAKTQLGKKSN
jgi:hypothetical protein